MARRGERSEPWERRKGESTPAFQAFTAYLVMGVSRNLRAVARELDKSLSLLGRWSSRWGWRERCEAWDTEETLREAKERVKELSDARKRHGALARAMFSKIAERLTSLDVSKLSPADLARWAEVVVRIEYLSLGQPVAQGDSVTVNVGIGVQQGAQIPWNTHKELLEDDELNDAVDRFLIRRAERMKVGEEARSLGLPAAPGIEFDQPQNGSETSHP